MPDHEERGYRMVSTALLWRAGAGRPLLQGHQVTVRRLTYRGAPLRNVLVFAMRNAGSVSRIVMYTPGAPDGRAFREFADRQEADRQVLTAPAFREYLLDRLPMAFAEWSADGTTRRFKGDRLAQWVFAAPASGQRTFLPERFEEEELSGDFLAAAFDAHVDARKADVDELRRQASHWRFSPLGTPVTTALVGTVVSESLRAPFRALKASYRFYDQVKARDYGSAVVSMAEAYNSALDVVVPVPLGAAGGRALVRLGQRGMAASVALDGAASPSRARFASKYLDTAVRPRSTPDADGIHRVGGRTFVQHEGGMYGVRYDASHQVWRLQPAAGAMDVQFGGPAIRQVDGVWQFASDIGLRGGMRRRLRDRFREALHIQPPGAQAGGAAAQPAPAPPDPVVALLDRLPAPLQHRRDEFHRALRDNPSAMLRVRQDGSGGHVDMPLRPAVLVDNELSPVIRAIDAS